MASKNRVTIDSDVKTETGTSKQGKPFTERYQDAFLHVAGSRYPKSCKVTLYDNARPYPIGDYETDQDLEISEFGRLQVKRDLVLIHAPSTAKA